MDNPVKDNVLRSWKEIAAYLGYDQRTCYRWEQKFGMPVHRAEGGASKSPVIAYKDEIDGWFQATFTNSNPAAPPEKAHPGVPRWPFLVLFPAVAAAAFLIVRHHTLPAGQPADFAIHGSTLVVLDVERKAIWRHDLKVDGLQGEDFYRTYFQAVDSEKSAIRLPSLVIRDLDGDGRNEVLFAVQKRDDSYGEGDIFCFGSRGRELWRFHGGREMRFGGRTYSGDYRIHGFTTHDFNGDGRQEILIISNHYPQWPCQLAVLDSLGRMTGEYWNSGQLKDICFQDLDGDGKEEMLVAGINNEYGGCLMAFDPARVSGGSPQAGEFRADGLGPGSERSFVRLPRTDVSLALGDIVEGIQHFGIASNGHLMVYTIYDQIFDFDFKLRCLGVDWGHGFMVRHNELRAAGKIHTDLDNDYRELFRKGVRYWDGTIWVAEPTPNLRNVRPTKLEGPASQ